MPKYNHAFTIAFTIESSHPTGDDITGEQFRLAICKRLAEMPDSEFTEACGMPYDTYEIEEG